MNNVCTVPYRFNAILFFISMIITIAGYLLEVNGLTLLGGVVASSTLIPPALAAQIVIYNDYLVVNRYTLFYMKKNILNLNSSKTLGIDLSETKLDSSIKFSPIRILTDMLFKKENKAKEIVLNIRKVDGVNNSLRLRLKFSDANHLLALQHELNKFR